ncbi:uncharacterized protein [Haliotis asinina]|uniref:uncharacterized protein isoform X1 n=2 Tax=Haliotis asinina TaxID=109174 RepID=UPI003532581A
MCVERKGPLRRNSRFEPGGNLEDIVLFSETKLHEMKATETLLMVMLLQLLLVLQSVFGMTNSVELRWWRYQRIQKKNRTYDDCNVEAKAFRHGQVFVLDRTGPCVKYRCQYGGYKVINHGSQCREGRRCWDLHSYRTSVCTLEQCLEIDGRVRFVVVGEGCQFEKKCYKVGTTWIHNCYLYICRKEDVHMGVVFKSVLLGGRCRDVYGNCHDAGTFFHYRMGRTLYRFCSCKVRGGNIQYDCLP